MMADKKNWLQLLAYVTGSIKSSPRKCPRQAQGGRVADRRQWRTWTTRKSALIRRASAWRRRTAIIAALIAKGKGQLWRFCVAATIRVAKKSSLGWNRVERLARIFSRGVPLALPRRKESRRTEKRCSVRSVEASFANAQCHANPSPPNNLESHFPLRSAHDRHNWRKRTDITPVGYAQNYCFFFSTVSSDFFVVVLSVFGFACLVSCFVSVVLLRSSVVVGEGGGLFGCTTTVEGFGLGGFCWQPARPIATAIIGM